MKKICIIVFPLFLYALLSFIYFGLHLYPDFTHQYFGMSGDCLGAMWTLHWWPYAISHGLNVFFTTSVWAPFGYNLTESLSMPLLGILVSPLITFFGVVAAYNFTTIFASALSAYTAYWLCRSVTKSFWPSLFGGYFFGFSSYAIAQSLAHLCLVVTFLLPLLVLIWVLYFKNEIHWLFLVLLTALLVTGIFLINTEMYVVLAFFMAVFLSIAFFFFKEKRSQVFYFGLWLACGYLLSLLILSPYVYEFVIHGSASYQKNILSASMDLFNLFIPTPVTWLGGDFFVKGVSRHFRTNLFEANAYLGLPLILITIFYLKEFWHEKTSKFLFWMLIILIVASLGPALHWRGHQVGHLPWALMAYVPVLKAIIPARFPVYISLITAVIVALWLQRSAYNNTFKYVIAGLAVLFLLPNFNPDPSHTKYPSHLQWSTKLNIPDFFSKDLYKRYLKKNAIVVTLPYYQDAACEPGVWQVQSKMYFRLGSACLGGNPKKFLEMPVSKSLTSQPASKVDPVEFQQYLNVTRASAIVVKDSLFPLWQPLFLKLHLNAQHIAGVAFISLGQQ